MLLIIKKKSCFFIFLLASFPLSLYGMKRSLSCPDMNSDGLDNQQLQQVKHRSGLKNSLYKVLDLDYRGRPKNSVSVENPVEMPPKAVQILLGKKNYQEETIFLVPQKLPEPISLWRQCLNIFNMVWNNPMMEKYVGEEIFPKLIIFLQNFLMENRGKSKLKKQLYLEIKKGKRLEEKLKKRNESLEGDSRYFKQLSALHGCLLSSGVEES